MKIDMALINYLEKLSKIKLSQEESQKAMADLNKILNFMDILNKVETEGVAELSHPFHHVNSFREDKICASSFQRPALLSNAPYKNDTFFKAPKTLD